MIRDEKVTKYRKSRWPYLQSEKSTHISFATGYDKDVNIVNET